MSEEEPRSAPVEEDPNKIDVKVVSQDGQEVYFKINKKTTLRKLMDAYQARVGKAANQVRFLYDGERIREDDTPEGLKMQNDDVIDAVAEQTGGF